MIADRRAHSPGRGRSIRVLIAAIGLAVAVIAATACSGNESDATTTSTLDDGGTAQSTGPPVACYTVAQSDPTGPLTVNIGAQFAVVLEAEPASGYSWQPTQPVDPELVLTVGTEFRGPGEACGVDAETQVLRYVGRAPGTASIALHYSRPASQVEGDQSVTFTVNVVDPTTTTTPPPDTSLETTTTTGATTTTKAKSTTTTKAKSTTTTTRAPTTTTTAGP